MSTFASTSNLVLRSFRESDVDRLADLWTSYESQRFEPGHVLPSRPDKLKARLPDIVDGMTLFVVVEAKSVPASVVGDAWVGQAFLRASGAAKNQAAELGISFEPRWWSKVSVARASVTFAKNLTLYCPGLRNRSRQVACGLRFRATELTSYHSRMPG
jgi:RimJ/RimL family protein N-acetyltransferase